MIQIVTPDTPPKLGAAMMLALDEACLMAAEAGEFAPSLRTWEFLEPTVVLGRSSKVDRETDRDYCDRNGIEIFRRCSGGASVVGGPGCLMYSVVLSIAEFPQAAKIDGAHEFVMGRVLLAARRQLPQVNLQGICDLTWQNQKFSGNALRITRGHVLYHGTLLYRSDLDVIARCLDFAPRQPAYRDGRDHRSFITNAPLDPDVMADDLADVFTAEAGDLPEVVLARARDLVSKRYSCEDWRYRH